MKLKKVEQYSAGYSKESVLKKCAAGALGVVMLGALAGCGREEQYDSGMTCEPEEPTGTYVSESDRSGGQLPYEGKVATPSEDGEEEPYLLDGDVAYVPEAAESE